MNKEPLTYTDENGNKMYGYSQTSLDQLRRAIYVGYILFALLLLGIYFFIDYFNVIDYIAFKFKGGC